MTPAQTARALIEKVGSILSDSERLYLRRVLAGIEKAAGEMWDEITGTFAHFIS